MKEIFGFEGGFTAACSRIFDLMILGFLWILCSLPIITIGASSAALYYATVKSVKNRNGYAVQEFPFLPAESGAGYSVVADHTGSICHPASEYRDFDGEGKRICRAVFYLPVCGSCNLYRNGSLLSLSGVVPI